MLLRGPGGLAVSMACASTLLFLFGCTRDAPEESAPRVARTISLDGRTVEASCGQCQFELPGSGCDLAVGFDGNFYYVDGSHLDDHGDAHAHDGMCNAVRAAIVTGTVVDGRFQAERFELVDEDS